MERREAPGNLRGSLTDLARVRFIAPTAISPLPRIAADGVRAANDVGRCASRGSTVTPLSGATPHSVIKRRDKTTPSMSEAAGIIIALERAGISIFCSAKCANSPTARQTPPSLPDLDPRLRNLRQISRYASPPQHVGAGIVDRVDRDQLASLAILDRPRCRPRTVGPHRRKTIVGAGAGCDQDSIGGDALAGRERNEPSH